MKQNKLLRIGQVALLLLLTGIAVFPLLWAIASSLRPDTEIYQYALPFQWHTFVPVEFTFDAYVKVFRDFKFHRPLFNTLIVSVVTVLLSCVLNSLAAFGFTFFDFKGKKFLFALTLVSFMVPFESIAISLYKVINRLDWVDTYQGLIIPTIADGLVLFLFVQFFGGVRKRLFEAARIDGANWGQVYFRILIPVSKPVFITAGLMTFINQWNSFMWPLLVAHGKEMRLVQVALSDFTAEHVTLWSCLYAASVISAIFPLLLFLPFQKYYVQGIASSGIKG